MTSPATYLCAFSFFLLLSACSSPAGTTLPYARYQCSRDDCAPVAGVGWTGPVLFNFGIKE